MEQSQPKFEHAALEKDIQELASEIKKKEAEPSKEALGAALKQRIYAPEELIVRKDASAKEKESPRNFLPSYIQKSSQEITIEVEKLIDKAFHKGLSAAIKEAKENPLLLDAFHDAITEKLYEEFKKRGILK